MPLAFSITPTSICQYHASDFEDSFSRSLTRKKNTASNKRKTNELSANARRRLKKSSQNLIYLSKKRTIKIDGSVRCSNFRAAFITLKLPSKQMHSHSEIIKSCLNQFLVQMRKYYGIKNYVWKAELQRNGNIHFHLLVDRYIHYMAVRKYWNQSIEKLGYVSTYRNCREKMDFNEYNKWRILEGSVDKKINRKAYDYGVETEWKKPNTTDVKFVNNDKKAAHYISKYLSKNESNEDETGIIADSREELTGRLWYCSQSLSRLKNFTIKFRTEISKMFKYLKKLSKTKKIENDFFSIVYFNRNECGKNFRHELDLILIRHAFLSGYPFPSKFADVFYHSKKRLFAA